MTNLAQKPPSVQATITAATSPAIGAHQPYSASAGALAPVLPALSTTLVNNASSLTVEKAAADTSSNAVTVTCAGSDTFYGGATTVPLVVPGERVEIQASNLAGTNVWKVVRHHAPRASYDTRFGKLAQVADLTYPLIIPHRGGGNLHPENTLAAYQGTLSLGAQAVEAGDLQATADGGVVCMHDSTVDRTTTGAGNVTTATTPGVRLLTVDASVWFGGNWPDQPVPSFDDVLASIGGQIVLVPEIKDTSDATATLVVNKIVKYGLQKSVIIASASMTNLAIATAASIATMFVQFSSVVSSWTSVGTLAAAGVGFVTMAYNSTGDIPGYITTAHASGIKCIAFTVDHQADWDTAVANGFDGAYSNDPVYITRNYTQYRKGTTTWAQNGTWGHGMTLAGYSGLAPDGPYTTTQRGKFTGVQGAWRFQPVNNSYAVMAGAVSPVPSPSGSYTITIPIAFEQLPTTTSEGAVVFFCLPSDRQSGSVGNLPSCYEVKVRQTGVTNAWVVDGAGTATAIGTITATAPSIPTLSAGLTSGVAITSIPVNALTVALKVGHQFYLPTGQVVTLTAAAAVSATSLTVTSDTPSAAVVSGAGLIPRITITITVSPTTIGIVRTDESGVGSISATNSTQRGGYIAIQNAVTAGAGAVSYESVTVA